MKRIISTILLFFSVLALFANPVDEHQARSLALQFLQNNSKAGTRSGLDLKRAETGVTDTEDASIYVFNYDEGYVVISGNDLLPAVLGMVPARRLMPHMRHQHLGICLLPIVWLQRVSQRQSSVCLFIKTSPRLSRPNGVREPLSICNVRWSKMQMAMMFVLL